MENVIKIEVPKGHRATFNEKENKIIITENPKDVMERIKTVADILLDHGIKPEDFKKGCEGLDSDEIAYRILKLLTKSLNEGWTPDWSNSSEYKYFPWFEMKDSSGFRFLVYGRWASHSDVGSRLCFKTRALAEYAVKQFLAEYKQFMVTE